MWQKRIIFSIVAGLLILVLSGAVSADSEARLFFAKVQGNANPMPSETDPCIMVNTETGTGLALYMGKVSFDTEEIIDFCSNPDPDRANIKGEFVFTAANGDQIFGVVNTVGRFDYETNEIAAFGSYELTGGTGRFEDAEGKGKITVGGSLLPPFELKGILVGRISF